jgi:hypothetical protein
LGVGEQVDGDYGGGQPGRVDAEAAAAGPARCRGRSGCVLYPDVGAVPGVQPGVLPGGGVDGQGGVAVAVGLFDQVELGAGCGRSRRTITRVPAG